MRPKAKLVLVNAPTRDSEKSRSFYGALLGAEFAQGFNPNVVSWWTPILRGVDFTITIRYDDRERLTPYFAVENLDSAIRDLEAHGGRVVVPPRDVVFGPEQAREAYVAEQRDERRDLRRDKVRTVGRMAVVLDPDLNYVGLIQVAPDAKRHFGIDDDSLGVDEREAEAFKMAKQLSDRLEREGALPTI